MEEDMVTIEDFKKMEIRIAEVLSAAPHPQADRLLVLRIRVEEAERTIVAGIRKYYSEAELVGKKIVVVTNLEPAEIRGIRSEGMLLAASLPEKLTLLVPDRDILCGARVG